jgi:hypothetical protein
VTDELIYAADDAVEWLEAADGRTIRLRLFRYGETGRLATGPEIIEAGALDGTDPGRVTIEAQRHGGPLVGVGTDLEHIDGVPYLTAAIARTPAGEELLELARAKVLRAASVVYRPIAGTRRADGVNVRSRIELVRVAVLERGAFPSAEVVAASLEVPHVTEQSIPSLDEIGALVRGIVTDAIPAPVVQVPAPSPRTVLPATAGDMLQASLDGDVEMIAAFKQAMLEAAAPDALVDGVTGDVPPIVRPAWLNEIVGIIPRARAVVNAFGTRPLPDSGMEIDWPVWDGNASGFVSAQAAEKDIIGGKKLVLTSDKVALATLAGGIDVSWQVLRRSSPSYRDAVMRILAVAWAIETDKAFAATLVSKGTGTGTYDATSGEKLHASLLAASAKVDDATGMPADFVLAGSTAWLTLASAAGVLPSAYGTQNLPGTAQASTLSVNVSGLPIIRARNMAADAVIVSNASAASCYTSGMLTATQDVVARLGTDVAVWSMDGGAVFIPTGIVKLTAAAGG